MTTVKAGREAGELPPAHGARFVLELVSTDGRQARYAVRVETESPALATATLGEHGVALGPWSTPVEPWAEETALGFCRMLAKNHTASGDWPAVLRRWRSPRGE